MAEYIDRVALIAEYDRVHKGPPGGARKLMVDAPTADVVEVKHGKWIMENYETISPRGRIIRNKNFKCSICGRSNGRYNTSYCGGCGAKMDGVTDICVGNKIKKGGAE